MIFGNKILLYTWEWEKKRKYPHLSEKFPFYSFCWVHIALNPIPHGGGGEVDSTNHFKILEFLLILLISYPDTGWLFLNINWLNLGTQKIGIFWRGTTFLALQKYWDFFENWPEKITHFFIAESFDTRKMMMFARN